MHAQTVSASFKSLADVNGDQYSTDLPLRFIKLDPEIAAAKNDDKEISRRNSLETVRLQTTRTAPAQRIADPPERN